MELAYKNTSRNQISSFYDDYYEHYGRFSILYITNWGRIDRQTLGELEFLALSLLRPAEGKVLIWLTGSMSWMEDIVLEIIPIGSEKWYCTLNTFNWVCYGWNFSIIMVDINLHYKLMFTSILTIFRWFNLE